MKTELKRRTLLAGTAAVAAIGAARAQAADLQPLYQAAKAANETQLSIYLPAAASDKPFFDAFAHEFPGIAIAPTDLFGAALFARLEAEQASGKPQADLVLSGDLDFPTLASHGWLRAYQPVGADKLPAQYLGADGKWVVWSLALVGPVVNTTAIKTAGPHAWADLTDPALHGKVAMTSATTLSTSPMALVEAMNGGVINQSWVDAFAKLEPAVLNSTSAVMQAVATGQYAMAPFMALVVSDNAKAKGAPVGFWYLKEGNSVVPFSAGVLATAPHPHAAELFASWLLGPTSQKVSATLGQIGTPPNSPTPPDFPAGTKLYALTGDAMQKALKDWFAGPAKTLAR